MRVEGGWIVEVNGVPGPDCFARRIHRADVGRLKGAVLSTFGRRRVKDAGRLMAVYLRQDVMATPAEVAELVWSWPRGVVSDGYALRDL